MLSIRQQIYFSKPMYIAFLLTTSCFPEISHAATLLPGNASTYGYGEKSCGQPGKAIPCSGGAITASGVPLQPWSSPQVAVAANIRLAPGGYWQGFRVDKGACVLLHVVDKMNPEWATGVRGEFRSYDLTPAALAKLGLAPNQHWQGVVHPCTPEGRPRYKRGRMSGDRPGIWSGLDITTQQGRQLPNTGDN